ncbi:hypothetical protein [Streptomyces sp. NPDC048737]|uniref:hypothetical protein n=1 Tax=unclassified Streptomyces TaxID=2593676 RepID=UPI00341CBD95
MGGYYTRADRPLPAEYDHPGTVRRLAALDETAAETGTNRNRVVPAWLAGGNPAATPVVGVSTVEQLDEAIAGVSCELTAEQRERPDSAVRAVPTRASGPGARRPRAARRHEAAAGRSVRGP